MSTRRLKWLAACAAALIGATTSPAGAVTTGNLLRNGDAEEHLCTDDWTAQTPVPGWTVLRGAASVTCWSAFGYTGDIPALPASGTPGLALFAAPGADTAIEQVVDVSSAAGAIDRGDVTFKLSGWLGGWRDRPEQAVLTAIFLDRDGRATGAPVVVAGAGAEARGRATALLARSERGAVPAGTRHVAVTVDFVSGISSFQNAYADNLSLTLSGDVGALPAAAANAEPASAIPALDHVYVVMMENTNHADIVHDDGRGATIDPRMPFLASMAKKGVLLTDMWGTYHPSDQNYVAMVAGNTYRYGPVYYPDYDLTVSHLGDLLDAQGRSWVAYVQNMKAPCNLVADSNGGWYAPDDEPFAQFDDVVANSARCLATMRDLSDWQAAVAADRPPAFAWIAADGWWDGEGAWLDNFDMSVSLQRQDEFLASTFSPLLQSSGWKHSRSLLVITWDESLGWGWPDNHIATVVVGSPGLLREGSLDRTHYDGYGVLRTIEQAFGLGGLDRFDRHAVPLTSIFRSGEAPQGAARLSSRAANPLPARDLATRGTLAETFGQITVPASAERGQTIHLIAQGGGTGAAVVLAPLGQAPGPESVRAAFDGSGIATFDAAELEPGFYGAWQVLGEAAPVRAPVPVRVLPRGHVSPVAPGVEIFDSPRAHGESAPIFVREGANALVRYCRPQGSAPGDTWIGVFPAGTTPDQLTQAKANAIGYWLKTPGDAFGGPCGEAMASASELPVNAGYQVLLLTNTGAAGVPVGRSDAFTLTPALPH
ncbi:MAG: hypothetical protein JOZ49_04815 [Mycolicibacterium sp.]|nr:hypothetical protein [Mycolicibacterium sp.]